MLTIFFNIIVGVIAGGFVAWLANLIKKPGSSVQNIVTYALGLVFGGLGGQAADQLLNWGPTLFGSSIIPVLAGGLVLSFVVLYTGKTWFKLGTQA
ncbi:hypothetical protein [Schleiferilactobacillus harbinensis]|uniref:hypothetical protein n=1 Tax=Schleiferilactobacillus harbinensis TaxID=304207 RepID=UPI0021A5FDD4|nr:hypothetical protein [Schleiferilactobacillus harbinensis]